MSQDIENVTPRGEHAASQQVGERRGRGRAARPGRSMSTNVDGRRQCVAKLMPRAGTSSEPAGEEARARPRAGSGTETAAAAGSASDFHHAVEIGDGQRRRPGPASAASSMASHASASPLSAGQRGRRRNRANASVNGKVASDAVDAREEQSAPADRPAHAWRDLEAPDRRRQVELQPAFAPSASREACMPCCSHSSQTDVNSHGRRRVTKSPSLGSLP